LAVGQALVELIAKGLGQAGDFAVAGAVGGGGAGRVGRVGRIRRGGVIFGFTMRAFNFHVGIVAGSGESKKPTVVFLV